MIETKFIGVPSYRNIYLRMSTAGMDEFEKLFCWLVPVPYIHTSERGLAFGLQLSLALALALAVALVGRIRAKTRKLDLFQVFIGKKSASLRYIIYRIFRNMSICISGRFV